MVIPSVGPLELIIVAVIFLLIVGPKALPALARRAGSVAKIGKREADEFKGVLSVSNEKRDEPAPERAPETVPEHKPAATPEPRSTQDSQKLT